MCRVPLNVESSDYIKRIIFRLVSLRRRGRSPIRMAAVIYVIGRRRSHPSPRDGEGKTALRLIFSTSDQHGDLKSEKREPVSTLDNLCGVPDR